MARSEINRALSELRGTIDGWTYRKTPEGKLTVYKHRPSKKAPSKKQLSGRDQFSRAQHYSNRVLADPARQLVYRKLANDRKRPTNTLLVANFLNPPQLELVELAAYSGRADQPIRVVAFDDIAVATVTVAIRSGDGAVIESGLAVDEHGVWVYRTTTTLPEGAPWLVEVTAKNRPGHAMIGAFPDPRNPTAGGPTFRSVPPDPNTPAFTDAIPR